MGIWSKLTASQVSQPSGRTAKERKRRAKDISRIDASTSNWLASGGRAAKTPKGWS